LLSPSPTPLAEIPIELRHGLPTVKVTVSGAQLDLFLDLGAYVPIGLTALEMERAQVQVLPGTTQLRDALGQAMEARHFLARDVALAGYKLGDLTGAESLSMGGFAPPDRNGYIGRPVLASYLLVLDTRITECGSMERATTPR
jgi:hypothetical protein